MLRQGTKMAEHLLLANLSKTYLHSITMKDRNKINISEQSIHSQTELEALK